MCTLPNKGVKDNETGVQNNKSVYCHE